MLSVRQGLPPRTPVEHDNGTRLARETFPGCMREEVVRSAGLGQRELLACGCSRLVPRSGVEGAARIAILRLASHWARRSATLRASDRASEWNHLCCYDAVATVTLAHRASHHVPAGNSTSGTPLRHASYARRYAVRNPRRRFAAWSHACRVSAEKVGLRPNRSFRLAGCAVTAVVRTALRPRTRRPCRAHCACSVLSRLPEIVPGKVSSRKVSSPTPMIAGTVERPPRRSARGACNAGRPSG